jgi:hypothetical protein
MRKPFDVLAEGLLSKESRRNWIPIELFVRGVKGLEEQVRRLVMAA